jgi:hypothetical protein
MPSHLPRSLFLQRLLRLLVRCDTPHTSEQCLNHSLCNSHCLEALPHGVVGSPQLTSPATCPRASFCSASFALCKASRPRLPRRASQPQPVQLQSRQECWARCRGWEGRGCASPGRTLWVGSCKIGRVQQTRVESLDACHHDHLKAGLSKQLHILDLLE